MKEYEITELMRDHTDNEFGIEGENAADTGRVVEIVMEKLQTKKKAKPIKLLIAAVAAALVLAGTATAATIVIKGGYTTPTGLDVSYEAGEDYSSWSMRYDTDRESPIKVEDGNRLMFVADGQNTDITDLVNENTPYIYSYVNCEGGTCYIVVGGAAGDYGYIDLVPIKTAEDAVNWNEIGYNTHVPKDQWVEHPEDSYDNNEMAEEKWDEYMRSWFKPWCLAAFDELEVWGSISGFGDMFSDTSTDFNKSFGYVFSSESIVES